MTARRYRDNWPDYDPPADLGPLFDQPAPSYPVDTSEAAAESLGPVLGTLRWRVLEAVCAAPDGLTTYELEQQLDMVHQTVSPRVWEMARRMRPPLMRYSEDKRQRSHVVRPTEAGLAFYSEKAREAAA